MDDGHVWYVAYGSNLSLVRLRRYLARAACTDDPGDAVAMTLPHRLFFAHESRVWGGGTAFLDPRDDPEAGTLCTAWLLRTDQFLTVLAGENGRSTIEAGLRAWPAPGEAEVVAAGRYGLVLGCSSPDARPALTVTTSASPLPRRNAPVAEYVDTIVTGLVEGHGLDPDAARAYLAERLR